MLLIWANSKRVDETGAGRERSGQTHGEERGGARGARGGGARDGGAGTACGTGTARRALPGTSAARGAGVAGQ